MYTQHELLDAMLGAVSTAGQQALAKQKVAKVVVDDGGGSLTTDQDYAAEENIVALLKGRFPDMNILAEENPKKTLTPDTIIVDPIDATVNYHRGGRDWSVTAACLQGGEVTAGVIYQPAVNIVVTAMRGEGCFVAEAGQPKQRIRLSQDPFDLGKAIVAMPLTREFSDAVVDNVQGPMIKSFRFVRNNFSNTGSIVELLLGITDAFTGWAKIWDFAAGKLFVEEAGGVTGDMWGNPFDLTLIEPQRIVFARSREAYEQTVQFTSKWPKERDLRGK